MVLGYFISFLYAFYDICPKRVPKTTFGRPKPAQNPFGQLGRPISKKVPNSTTLIDIKIISVSHLWPELDLFCQPSVALFSLPTLSPIYATPIQYSLRFLVFNALPAEVGLR